MGKSRFYTCDYAKHRVYSYIIFINCCVISHTKNSKTTLEEIGGGKRISRRYTNLLPRPIWNYK